MNLDQYNQWAEHYGLSTLDYEEWEDGWFNVGMREAEEGGYDDEDFSLCIQERST
jgi:hypothetical protein